MSQPLNPSARDLSTPPGAPPALTLETALDRLRHGVTMAPSAQFPDTVNARLASAAQTAARQCAKVPPAASRRVLGLLDVAVKAPTAGQRVAWHRRAAAALASAFAPHAASRRLQPLLPHPRQNQRRRGAGTGPGHRPRPGAAGRARACRRRRLRLALPFPLGGALQHLRAASGRLPQPSQHGRGRPALPASALWAPGPGALPRHPGAAGRVGADRERGPWRSGSAPVVSRSRWTSARCPHPPLQE